MLCNVCFTNKVRRTGGPLGICWQHRKTKCRACGELSGGKTLCIPCAHKEDQARWKAESNPMFFEPDHGIQEMRIRKERLAESRHHMHRAIEIAFQSLALCMEAMRREVDPAEDFKEAA